MPLDITASSRLRAMFIALQEQGGGQILRKGWATVLRIPEADVQYGQFGLPLVARVLSRAVEEAERADAEVGVLLRRDFIEEWRKPVFTPRGNLDAAVQQQPVAQEALAYLATIASVLQMRDGPQTLPEGDELAGLLAQVDDLASSVEASADLPEEVKRILLRKINAVRFAIESVRIGGPEGVHEAVEALIGAAVVRRSAVPDWMRGKIAAFLVAFYALFTAGPEIQASIEAWHDMGRPVIEAVSEAIDDDDAERLEPPQPPDDEPARRRGRALTRAARCGPARESCNRGFRFRLAGAVAAKSTRRRQPVPRRHADSLAVPAADPTAEPLPVRR